LNFATFSDDLSTVLDRLCGPVVIDPSYRSRGLEFDSRPYQIFREIVGL
jgi:hypothetical protein